MDDDDGTGHEEFHPDFECIELPDGEGGTVIARLPKARVPVYARPGMAVRLAMDNDDAGVIIAVHSDYAVVRTCKGRLIVQAWGMLDLIDVQPDPAFIDNATSNTAAPGDRGLKYHGELRQWITPLKPIAPRTFAVHELVGDFGMGVRIATITVDDGIDPESAARLANLMTAAPELWRELRETARWYLVKDTEQLDEFARLTEVLWDAAGRRPFEVAEADQADEPMWTRVNDETVNALAERQGK
ncbi:MAG TPA: hypothetical protein VH475_08200 [Tepidisphaeraceae bacterium]